MKKLLLSLAVLASSSAFAQVFDVASVEKLNMSSNGVNVVAGISPKGDYLLFTGSQLEGLVKYDLTTGRRDVLSTALGAGNDAKISADGKNVVYREDKLVKGLRYTDVVEVNTTTGVTTKLVKATRNLNAINLQGGNAMIVNSGRMTQKRVSKSLPAVKTTPVVSIDNRQLMITKNGVTSVLSPNGKQYSYIWASVSPNGKKVCYYVCGVGCFVCNIDGSGVQEMGILRAAQWYDDNTVVGMRDYDDGHTIIASAIIAKTLDGKSQKLTDDSLVAMYPYPSEEGKKIAFSTYEGETYIINVK